MRCFLTTATWCCALVVVSSGIGEVAEPTPVAFQEPEELVREIYAEVSRTGDGVPDWSEVRIRFHPQAVIVLRATRDEIRLMTVDEFIDDFVAFYDRIGPEAEFTETVIEVETLRYGDVASCSVVYEAAVAGSERGPQRGLDLWHLVKQDGRWWVVSVVNESEPAAGPIPEALFRE